MKIVQRKIYKEFKWKITEEKLWSIFVSNLHFVTNNLPWALINILINILIDILINILINILVNISTEKRELIYFVGTHYLWRKAIGISLFDGWKPSLLFYFNLKDDVGGIHQVVSRRTKIGSKWKFLLSAHHYKWLLLPRQNLRLNNQTKSKTKF